MIVLDASVAITGLLTAGSARELLAGEAAHAPHLIDAEVAGGLRRHAATGPGRQLAARAAIEAWPRLGIVRHSMFGSLGRIWQLRENLSAYDACYVALAEILECALVTADGRLGRAPGPRCSITVLPR